MQRMKMSISQKPNLLVGENYNFTLNQSIKHLLSQTHQKSSDPSNFIDTFYQLMQSKLDPPLESIWVFAVLSFKTKKNHLSTPRELFRFISGCSGSCSAPKSIALLAPVVFEMHKLVIGAGEAKISRKEVALIGDVLGYISVCCSKGMSEGNDLNFDVSVADLVSIWMDGEGELKQFLPLTSDEMCREISVGCTSVNSFAGVVMFEVFLLKLCVDLRVGSRGLELENELKKWIVGSVTGFQNFYFFETLVKMLLEPTLPVDSLLGPEDATFLRTILYDSTILVEYSFLRLEKAINLPADRVRSLAVKRLVITSKAIDYFRKNGDRKRAISYANSFSNSQLGSLIIKFVTSQIGMEEEASKLKGASPNALIKWLLNLDGQGIRIFDDRTFKSHAESVVFDSMFDNEQSASKTEGKKADADLRLYIDNEGQKSEDDDDETNMLMNDAFVAAAHTMRSSENAGRKRKDGRVSGGKKKKKKNKVVEDIELSENSDSDVEKSSLSSDDGPESDSESEVENPISESDEDV